MWIDRLLYTGDSLQEAIDKAMLDITAMNANVSAAIGRPITLQSYPFINTAFPEIDGHIAYCNVIKPLQYWIDNFNAMQNVENFYTEAEFDENWNVEEEQP